jgi:hypothetical protein
LAQKADSYPDGLEPVPLRELVVVVGLLPGAVAAAQDDLLFVLFRILDVLLCATPETIIFLYFQIYI